MQILFHQERIKLGERIPHISLLPIVIPLKLFVECIRFPADNFSSDARYVEVSRRNESAKEGRSARVAINAKQSDTIRNKNI